MFRGWHVLDLDGEAWQKGLVVMCLAMASLGIVECAYLVVGPGHLGFDPMEIGAVARPAVRWIALCKGRNESRCKSGLRLFLRVNKRSDAENSRSFFCLLEVIYASWRDDAHVDS